MSGEEYSDGKDGNDNKKKKSVGAVIEFKCDPDRSGLEGIRDVADGSTEDQQQQQQTRQLVRADENDSADNNSESLQFKSFGLVDDDSYVLKLDWRTRYACDDYLKNRNDEQSSSSRWGFFTWLIIMYAFLPLLPSLSSAYSFFCVDQMTNLSTAFSSA